jgi:Mce-associated membrane protein
LSGPAYVNRLPDLERASTYDAGVREAREGRPVALWVLVAVLVLACVVGGVQAAHARDSRERSETQQERYAATVAAAEDVATAFVNVRYDTADRDLGRIADLATGPLREKYVGAVDRFVAALRRERTVTAGSVVWAGVVRVDARSATVLVATSGTRADRDTDGKPQPRDLRLRLELVLVDGAWLASDIREVS